MTDASTPKDVDYSTALRAAYVLARLQEVLQTAAQRRRIAELTQIPAPTLKDYHSGRTSPPVDRFLRIAFAAGLDPVEFLRAPALMASGAAEPSLTMIPVLDVDAAAGPGTRADVVKAVGDLPFPTEFIHKLAPVGADLSCLRAAGDSMAPTIENGALLIVDERQKTPRPFRSPRRRPREAPHEDEIFIFIQSGDLRLKRLRDVGDGLVAILSDNRHDHPIEIVKPGRDGALAVIGKVIWWDNRL